jgi:hypothetical protein
MLNHVGETEEIYSHLRLELNEETEKKERVARRSSQQRKIQFKTRYAAAVSFHVHLKFLTVEFLGPTTLLRRRGLSDFAYLLNRVPLGRKVKNKNLDGR